MYKVLDGIESEIALDIHVFEEKGIRCQVVINDHELEKERRYDVCLSVNSVSVKTGIFYDIENVRLDVLLIERCQRRIVEAVKQFKKDSRKQKVKVDVC